jgi:hypothetical protein
MEIVMNAEKKEDYLLTVCTVNWFSTEFIKELFLNLNQKAANPEKIKYIVIDNTNGRDSQLSKITRLPLPVSIIPCDTKNLKGSFAHAAALNLAMGILDTEYTLIVDPDVHVFINAWDGFCIDTINAERCPSIGTAYPPWQLGMYHNFPTPVFCFFRTADYKNINADWTAYSTNPLFNFYNFLRRQVLRCCLFITRKKYQKHRFIQRAWPKFEKIVGVCSPDTGSRIALKAKKEKIKACLFLAALPDELPAEQNESLKNIAADFELYYYNNQPVMTHRYGTCSWVFRTARGDDKDYWRGLIRLFEKQTKEK